MTREQLKKWFDKLPTCNVHKGRQRLVTWEDIKQLALRIEFAEMSIFPEAQIETDNDGQIIIYTGEYK